MQREREAVLADDQRGGVQEHVPRVAVRLRDPVQGVARWWWWWSGGGDDLVAAAAVPFCSSSGDGRIGEEALGRELGLAAEVLAELGALDAEVQPRLRRRDDLGLLVRCEGADAVAVLPSIMASLGVAAKSTRYSSSVSPQCRSTLFRAWISGMEMKLPVKDDFLVSMSSSREGSSLTMSMSGLADGGDPVGDVLLLLLLL